MNANTRGFTLLELLLSVAMLGVLVTLTLPVTLLFSNRNDLDVAAQTTASAIRRVETYARGPKEDSGWGVRLQTGSIVIFKGADFTGRNSDFDEVVSLPASTTPSGLSELQFAKASGQPNTAGSITFTSTNNTQSRTVTINAKGTVDY